MPLPLCVCLSAFVSLSLPRPLCVCLSAFVSLSFSSLFLCLSLVSFCSCLFVFLLCLFCVLCWSNCPYLSLTKSVQCPTAYRCLCLCFSPIAVSISVRFCTILGPSLSSSQSLSHSLDFFVSLSLSLHSPLSRFLFKNSYSLSLTLAQFLPDPRLSDFH